MLRILDRNWETDAAFPSAPEHATTLAAQAAADGVDMVVAMGGDGVVHHVAQGLIGTGTTLGVVAAGTADVFARQLGMPLRPEAATKLLTPDAAVEAMSVLTFEAVGETEKVRRSAVFSLGMGVDAAIVEAAEADPLGKRGFGPFHFATTAVRMVRRELAHHAPLLHVNAETRSEMVIGVMAQFRQSYTYFGRSPLRLTSSPPAPLSLLLVRELRVRRAAAMIRAAAGRRGLAGARGFDSWEGIDGFTVESDIPVPIQADGEVIGYFTEMTAAILPGVLRVRHPTHR